MADYVVRVVGEDIELDDALIDGALNLMAYANGNNLDQETIRKAEQLKRRVAARRILENEFRDMKSEINLTLPNESNGSKLGNPKQKIQRLDQPSGAGPGPSSRVPLDQPSRAEPEPGPSSNISTEKTRPRARPSLPARIQDLIGLCSIPIRKKIAKSDVMRRMCRLSLPNAPVTECLKHIQLNPNEDITKGIPVAVYGPDGREYAMNFKLWSQIQYVLNTKGWNQFCQDYGLGNLVNMATLTIRMFRHRQTNDLCFAITW